MTKKNNLDLLQEADKLLSTLPRRRKADRDTLSSKQWQRRQSREVSLDCDEARAL